MDHRNEERKRDYRDRGEDCRPQAPYVNRAFKTRCARMWVERGGAAFEGPETNNWKEPTLLFHCPSAWHPSLSTLKKPEDAK